MCKKYRYFIQCGLSFIFLYSQVSLSEMHATEIESLQIIGTRIAAAGVPPNDIEIAFETLFNQEVADENERVELTNTHDFDELEDKFTRDESFGSMYCSSVQFLTSEIQNYVQQGNLLTLQIGPAAYRQVLILVNKNSNYTSISQLANKRLAQSDLSDIISLYVDTLLLKNNKPTSDKYFKSIRLNINGSASLLELFFKKADAVAIYKDEYDLAIELNPQLAPSTRVLYTSEAVISNVIALRKNLPEKRSDLFISMATNIHHSKRGENYLDILGGGKITRFNYRDLQSVQKMIEIYETHVGIRPDYSS